MERLTDVPIYKIGKVRDVYDLGDRLLIVASDRISAFDVVLASRIPEKGKILTQMSLFWMDKTKKIIENHLISGDVKDLPPQLEKYKSFLWGRIMITEKTESLPIEAVARGYLAGSGWRASLNIYKWAKEYALKRSIIIADTKFEFGKLNDRIILIDELLTSDSSRFWPRAEYEPGHGQLSFDKQYVRDYLETTGWDKKPPAPSLPEDVIKNTQKKYQEAFNLLTKE